MEIERMKLEALSRVLRSASTKVGECNNIVQSILAAEQDPNIPIDLDALKVANGARYAEAVQAAKGVVAALEVSWPP